MERLTFNYNLTDITPSEHLVLGGFANRKGLSKEVHRRLTSRCVVMKQGEVIICLIVNDLMDVDPGIIQSVKENIVRKTRIDIDSVIVTSIHTHSAPEMEYGRSEANDRYIKLFINKVSENAIRTITDKKGFEQAILKYGKSECDINIARRDVKPEEGGMAYRVGDPDGLHDDEVGILQFTDDSGNQKVTIFNYACHPVTLGYGSNYVSTDYPGRAREVVEQKEGGMAVFMNGAAGDLNPREAHFTDPAKTDSVGEKLGQAVLSAEMNRGEGNPDLKTIAKTIWVPFRDQDITKEHIALEAKRKASDITEFFTWQDMLDRWEKKVYEMIDKNEVKKSFPFKINIVKLGKAIIFFTQGELFVKYQLELKRHFPDYHILCVGYVHGVGAYIPTADVFDKKGYEADQSYIYEILPSPLSPAIEKIYLAGAVDAINELIE
jgi:neutral ceramidase